MSLIAKENSGTKELIPAGIHLAKCISIIDLGTQKVTFEKTEKQVHQVRFEFELPALTYEFEDKETKEKKIWTKVTWKNFTVSLHAKATMRKFLESWRGKKFTKEELEGFNLGNILGKTCQLQIIHSDDGEYANIENVLPMMAGIPFPESTKELISFEIQEDEKGNPTGYDEAIYDKLPEWLQKKIMESAEMMKLFGIETMEEQEENMKKEAEQAKAEQVEANAEPTVWEEDVKDIFTEDKLPEETPTVEATTEKSSDFWD